MRNMLRKLNLKVKTVKLMYFFKHLLAESSETVYKDVMSLEVFNKFEIFMASCARLIFWSYTNEF